MRFNGGSVNDLRRMHGIPNLDSCGRIPDGLLHKFGDGGRTFFHCFGADEAPGDDARLRARSSTVLTGGRAPVKAETEVVLGNHLEPTDRRQHFVADRSAFQGNRRCLRSRCRTVLIRHEQSGARACHGCRGRLPNTMRAQGRRQTTARCRNSANSPVPRSAVGRSAPVDALILPRSRPGSRYLPHHSPGNVDGIGEVSCVVRRRMDRHTYGAQTTSRRCRSNCWSQVGQHRFPSMKTGWPPEQSPGPPAQVDC
jgi:hypothetical protein